MADMDFAGVLVGLTEIAVALAATPASPKLSRLGKFRLALDQLRVDNVGGVDRRK